MDYLEFYGLEQEPFSQAPVLRFYFNSAQHSRALVRLMYAADTMKGLAMLIGDIGTGKTILARRMLDSLPEEEYESALLVIIHSHITADWLLTRIARQLGVEDPAPEKLKLLNQLYHRLTELHDQGKKAVVLIDEAQMLQSREIMEEFRGLLNLELPEAKLITFVFFGLTELEDYLHLDEPLAQRVALKCHLESFNRESTEGYINHRLRLAGAKNLLFNPDAITAIHTYSRGVPRLINTICDNSLFEGFLLKKRVIEEAMVQNIANDLGLFTDEELKRRKPVRARRGPGKIVPVWEGEPGEGTLPDMLPPTRRIHPPADESTEAELDQAMAKAGLREAAPAARKSAPVEGEEELEDMLDNILEKEPPPAKPATATVAKKSPAPAAAPAKAAPKAAPKKAPASEDDEKIDALFDDLEEK
jgi:type II secretory pathway predicted ATPase ExeA